MDKSYELLRQLYRLYAEGQLCSQYNMELNVMEDIPELVTIMKEVATVLPEDLSPLEATRKMRALEEEERSRAIKESKNKIIDMRKQFLEKMVANKGALGLSMKLVSAIERDSHNEIDEVIELMYSLKNYVNKDLPEQV